MATPNQLGVSNNGLSGTSTQKTYDSSAWTGRGGNSAGASKASQAAVPTAQAQSSTGTAQSVSPGGVGSVRLDPATGRTVHIISKTDWDNGWPVPLGTSIYDIQFNSFNNSVRVELEPRVGTMPSIYQAQQLQAQQLLQAQMLSQGSPFPGTIYHGTMAQGMLSYAAERRGPLEKETRFGEVTGYRCWRIVSGHLQSMSAQTVWSPGHPMIAREGWEKTDMGIHCFKDPHQAIGYLFENGQRQAVAYGEVKLWGTVVEFDLGYQAEFAAVSKIINMLPAVANDNPELVALRQTYGV